jgi:hypothetical protein
MLIPVQCQLKTNSSLSSFLLSRSLFFLSEYFLLSDLPEGKLLEGFISRGKTKYLSLTFDPLQNCQSSQFSVAATITESFIHNLSHPSDVPATVPASVRQALNHFFRPGNELAQVLAAVDGDEADKDGPGIRSICSLVQDYE